MLLLLSVAHATAQESGAATAGNEQQLESLAPLNTTAIKDDSYEQQEAYFKKHLLNMNTATAEALDALHLLTALQVAQFFLYRQWLGKLLNRYELQAIPGWDIATIQRLLPYITVADDKSLVENLRDRWKGGDEILVARTARVLEKSKGYSKPADSAGNYYLGSRNDLNLRYSYNYKNLLQWGWVADKDAGEQFFKGRQQLGFDFYSFHFFARKLGLIQALAVGDLTGNLGQGLLQWQSLAFTKSTEVLNCKRQAATLRPYNSAGEYNFHRGLGITLQKANWQTTLFASCRKISANNTVDTLTGAGAVSSFMESGYHRTAAENDDRNSVQQLAVGGALHYRRNQWQLGFNALHFRFSKPIQKQPLPYNLFALQGRSLSNASIDYSSTWHNMHVFGEVATDNLLNTAFVHGLIISLDTKIDAALLYRNISKAYRSVNANAFTENGSPVNEQGFYTAVSLRPTTSWKLDIYADMYHFPWLRYRVDAPSAGSDYLLQAAFSPGKSVAVTVCYQQQTKMINQPGAITNTTPVNPTGLQKLRLQANMVLNRQVTIRNRTELHWYNNHSGSSAAQGFLEYAEVLYKPARRGWQGNMRVQYFETAGYNERIYAYETDLPYNASVPFYYGQGLRYYCNLNWDASQLFNKKKLHPIIHCWLRWAQTIYTGKSTIGSGLDAISGNHQSEIKFELILDR